MEPEDRIGQMEPEYRIGFNCKELQALNGRGRALYAKIITITFERAGLPR